jgi:ATP-dependent exoDNAse (exonuclease V) beta subunit
MSDIFSISDRSTQFKIYSSSAGSGKTYTLAKEYIKLALRSKTPWYFNHILAVTFTNKAAGEMKERILKYLRQFSSNDPKEIKDSADIFNQILTELQADGVEIDETILRQRASATFKHIIHEYANFSVSTIDSFVQRIVSAFTEELGFPFNFEVNLESDVLLDAAVEQLLQKTNTETYEQITEAIKSFALEKADEGRSWNGLGTEIADFGRNLLFDQFQNDIDKIATLTPDDFLKIEQQLKDFNKSVEEQLKEVAKIALEVVNDNGLSIDDFPFKKNGNFSFFTQVYAGNVFKEAGKRTLDSIEQNTWHAKSAAKPIAASIMAIAETLTDCGNLLLSFQAKLGPRYFLYKEILKQLKKLALLAQLKKEIADIQQETGQIHISEFNRKILEIVLNEPIPFIYERLGERYNHILIDEFQDTSTLQWHNFLPLIENALASGHFNLAVGDAKQSIYRFRGGKMGLIVNLHKKEIQELKKPFPTDNFLIERYDSITPYLVPANLNTNYRSSKEVIEFNNSFFDFIKNHPDYQSIAPSLGKVYDEYFAQELPSNIQQIKTGGHVQIDFVVGKEQDRIMLESIYKTLEEVLSIGYRLSDIAILCRRNKDSRTVANELKEQNYNVISSDSLSLGSSDAINLVMAFMKVVQNPDNALAKYEGIYLYYRVVLNKIPNTQENKGIKEIIDSKNISAFFELVSYKLIPTALQQMTLYEIAEKLLQTFHLFQHDKELDFIFRFLDVVLEFQNMRSTHLTDFIVFWENKKNSLSISSPAGQNAITVTSVHKSKGLEFPVVIIPYCHWTTDTGMYSTRWFDLTEEILPELLLEQADEPEKYLATAPLQMVRDLEKTQLLQQYKDEKEDTFLESLNMLYVALTRPKDRLYLIVKSDISKFDKTVGNMLYQYAQCPDIDPTEGLVYVVTEGHNKVISQEKEHISNAITIQGIQSSERSQTIQLKHSAEKLFDLESFEKSKDYGNKVHAAFAKIKTVRDIDTALADIQREGLIIESEQQQLKATIQQIINLPEIKPYFEVEERFVRNEREILRPNQAPLRPDRVVKIGPKIVILDYKTGSKSSSHIKQVEEYRKIYLDMKHKEVEGILVYLETQEIVKV